MAGNSVMMDGTNMTMQKEGLSEIVNKLQPYMNSTSSATATALAAQPAQSSKFAARDPDFWLRLVLSVRHTRPDKHDGLRIIGSHLDILILSRHHDATSRWQHSVVSQELAEYKHTPLRKHDGNQARRNKAEAVKSLSSRLILGPMRSSLLRLTQPTWNLTMIIAQESSVLELQQFANQQELASLSR